MKYCNLKKLSFFSILIIISLLFVDSVFSEDKIQVFVSIAPQAFFVKKIGGNKVDVNVILPFQANHDFFEPKPQQLIKLYQAQIYVKIGIQKFNLESCYINHILDRQKKIMTINMSKGIKLLHGDPHIWMSPINVKQASINIYYGLSSFDPLNKEYYKKNLHVFLNELECLIKEFKILFKNQKNKTFIIYHPALEYFAVEYGLKQIFIETEGKQPSALSLQNILEVARKKNIKTIFVQKGFDQKSALSIAKELNGSLIEINPLNENWLINIKYIAKKISEVVK